jgi:glucokinase
MTTVGVAIGGTHLRTVVLAADSDEVLAETTMRTPVTGDRGAIVEVLVAGYHEAIGQAGLGADEIEAVGIGSPGVVVDGTVGQAVNVPGWSERFRLAEVLDSEFTSPVRIVNDITALAVAEYRRGAAHGHQNVLVVSVGTGVGGGLILDGEVYEGAYGAAGEFGHTVVEIDGAVCPCGRRGCVEAYAGQAAIERSIRRALDAGRTTSVYRLAEDLGEKQLSARVLRAGLDEGDPLIADLVEEAARALGKGIASSVNLLDVETVVVGGPLADQLGEPFIQRLDAAARPSLFLQPPRVEIVAAALGALGPSIGAAMLARGRESFLGPCHRPLAARDDTFGRLDR